MSRKGKGKLEKRMTNKIYGKVVRNFKNGEKEGLTKEEENEEEGEKKREEPTTTKREKEEIQ